MSVTTLPTVPAPAVCRPLSRPAPARSAGSHQGFNIALGLLPDISGDACPALLRA